MPVYQYTAVAPDGTAVKASAEAQSEESLRNELLLRNFEVTRVREKKSFLQIEITKQRIPPQEIMHFSRQMGAFVRSGVPIVDALAVIEEGTENKRFKEVLASMRESIEAGVPFADAVADHAAIFPPYYLGILRSAELTGQLDMALDQLSRYIERDLEARSKIKSALTYPLVIAAMSVVTVVVLTVFVLPRFAKFFEEFDAELPLATRMLLGISDTMQRLWFVFPILIALAIWMTWAARNTERGREVRDRVLLQLPLVGTIAHFAIIERFSRILGAMIRAGVPLPDSIGAATQGANNKVYEHALGPARDRMLEGEGLAGPISDTELFPRAAVQMMRVGEDTGTLDQQLENVGDYYSRELEYKLKRLTSLFEPMIIIAMGVVVGFVAVALISAMYGIFNSGDISGS